MTMTWHIHRIEHLPGHSTPRCRCGNLPHYHVVQHGFANTRTFRLKADALDYADRLPGSRVNLCLKNLCS